MQSTHLPFQGHGTKFADVNQYILETVAIHNHTPENEPRIDNIHAIDRDVTITFYPPEKIKNPQRKLLVPVYKYFMDLIEDKYVYVTGDWCERGTEGTTPLRNGHCRKERICGLQSH